jgi:hypothetical protein
MTVTDSSAQAFSDWIAGMRETPGGALEVMADLLQRSEAYFSLEASGLVLLGTLAAMTGGRLLIVLAVGVLAMTLAQELGLIVGQPVWLPEVFAVVLVVALIHLVLALFLGKQTAGIVLVAVFFGLVTLALFKPLALLRIPGLGGFFQRDRRR